jgi:hypothetical protein
LGCIKGFLLVHRADGPLRDVHAVDKEVDEEKDKFKSAFSHKEYSEIVCYFRAARPDTLGNSPMLGGDLSPARRIRVRLAHS